MKYRDHRGGFKESMATVQEFVLLIELEAHLNKVNEYYQKKVAEIKFEYVALDVRTEWNTYYVMQRFEGEDRFYVAGMSDGVLK